MSEQPLKYLKVDELTRLYTENRQDREKARNNWRLSGDIEQERITTRKISLCELIGEFEREFLHAKQAYDSNNGKMAAAAIRSCVQILRNVMINPDGVRSIPGPYTYLDQQWMFHQPVQYAKLVCAAQGIEGVPASLSYLFNR